MILRDVMRETLDRAGLLKTVRRTRRRFHNLLDHFFFQSPNWQRYILLNDEPYTSNFTTQYGQTTLKHCIDTFMPSQLKNARILDIGAADGCGMTLLQQKYNGNCEVYGLSINRFEVSDVRKKRTLRIRRGDMHSIPFRDEFFDVIFCKDTFEHSIAPYIALCEMNRVLKKQGLALFINPSPRDQRYLKVTYHFTILERWQMEMLLYKCHFHLEKVEEYQHPGGGPYDVYFCRKLDNCDPKSPKSYPEIYENKSRFI